MLTIAASGDSHFDVTSRWDECLRIHNWMADDFSRRKVDLFIHPGDWFERISKPPERNAVKNWLKRVAAERPVIGVRGNHDSLGDLEIFNEIRGDGGRVFIEEAASVKVVRIRQTDVAVACVAWPRKAELLAQLDREISRDQSEQVARDEIRNLMLGLRDELHQFNGPRILAMHAMVCGSTTSVGQPLVGCDLEVSLEELALVEPDIILLSHIHKPQEFEYNGIPIIYCGSPYATAYGETEVKGYVIAEFAGDGRPRLAGAKDPVNWYRVPTPRTNMILVNARYMPETHEFFYLDDLVFEYSMAANADVRFRYTVEAEHADAAKHDAARVEHDLWASGAVAVKLEEMKTTTTRARAPEVAQAVTLEEKLEVLWKTRGIQLDEETVGMLQEKTRALDQEVRDAV
jgi:DNA repair exonuclease SbcCD nuclease subunit